MPTAAEAPGSTSATTVEPLPLHTLSLWDSDEDEDEENTKGDGKGEEGVSASSVLKPSRVLGLSYSEAAMAELDPTRRGHAWLCRTHRLEKSAIVDRVRRPGGWLKSTFDEREALALRGGAGTGLLDRANSRAAKQAGMTTGGKKKSSPRVDFGSVDLFKSRRAFMTPAERREELVERFFGKDTPESEFIYIVGGRDERRKELNTVEMLEPDRNWRTICPMLEVRVHPACAAYYDIPNADDSVMGNALFVCGGMGKLGHPLKTVEKVCSERDVGGVVVVRKSPACGCARRGSARKQPRGCRSTHVVRLSLL